MSLDIIFLQKTSFEIRCRQREEREPWEIDRDAAMSLHTSTSGSVVQSLHGMLVSFVDQIRWPLLHSVTRVVSVIALALHARDTIRPGPEPAVVVEAASVAPSIAPVDERRGSGHSP